LHPSAQPSIPPPEQILMQERGCFFWSRVSVRSVGVECEDEHDEERKEISTFEPRRPELSFGISRRWDVAVPGKDSLREDHPASSLYPLPLFCIFLSVFALCSSCWPISMTFRGNQTWSLYYKDSRFVSFIDSRIERYSWLGNYRNK